MTWRSWYAGMTWCSWYAGMTWRSARLKKQRLITSSFYRLSFYHFIILSFFMRIPLWISNRHVHLSQIDCEKVFGKGYELKVFRNISQPGQFAAEELVTLVGEKGQIEKVRVVGPNRKTTQVELSVGDAYNLWVTAPIKVSGDTKDLGYIKIVWPVGEVYGPFAIIAQRHLHCTVQEAAELWIKSGDIVKMHVGGIRWIIFENVAVRAKDDYALDFHIDIEEANAAGVKPGDWAELIK